MEVEELTIRQAGKIGKVGVVAVRHAIHRGRLKARKVNGKWLVNPEDWRAYRLSRYDQANREVDGKRVYDPDEGRYTAHQAAVIIGRALGQRWSYQRLVYQIVNWHLKAIKEHHRYVVLEADLEAFIERKRRSVQLQLGEQE